MERRKHKVEEGRRIACIIPSLLPVGGVETIMLRQIQVFLEKKYKVDLVIVQDDRVEVLKSVPEQVRVFVLGNTRLSRSIIPIVKYLRRERPDAVHAAMWPMTIVTIFAYLLSRVKLNLIISDHNPLSIQYKSKGYLNWLVLRASIFFFYRFAWNRIAVSHGVAKDVARLGCLAIERFTVIHNPLTLPPSTSNSVEHLWNGWSGPRIVSVGRLKKQKNHRLLIDAFRLLLQSVDAKLMIAGTGELEQELRAYIKQMGLENKVLLAGQIADPQSVYRSANLFVLSSDYEGFGNVVVEALSCGTPVVSTNCVSGPAEILENGKYGELVPVGDAAGLCAAMRRSLSSQHDASWLINRSNDFSVEVSVGKYLKAMFS